MHTLASEVWVAIGLGLTILFWLCPILGAILFHLSNLSDTTTGEPISFRMMDVLADHKDTEEFLKNIP